nr:unnamed protein product [Callosobruchus chinensis]
MRHLVGSYSLYRKIFKTKDISFFSPKKDQCSLCVCYYEGDESVSNRLKEKFDAHVSEKIAVRELKFKKLAEQNENILCGVLDLQQVIYLPISNESAIFYKSRLSNFNFTFSRH